MSDSESSFKDPDEDADDSIGEIEEEEGRGG